MEQKLPIFSLTDEQRQIITAAHGHYVITAVAGSGKTTTLAHRIQHLLQRGMPSQRMLVLMFNRDARNDFVRRMGSVIPNTQRTPEVRTFHAMGFRLYRRFVEIGALKPYVGEVLSERETQFQVLRCLSKVLNPETLRRVKAQQKEHIEVGVQFIDSVKNSLLAPDDVLDELNLDAEFDYLPKLFECFEDWRQQARRISFADMLYDPVRALQHTASLRELVSNKMEVVLVDEYQDTSTIQHELLKLVAGDRARITIVGDPDQTIYEFRGAKPEYMLHGFVRDYPGAQALQLSYSFRYGHRVALLASHLIRQNQQRHEVLCKAAPGNPATQVQIHHTRDELTTLLQLLREQSPEQRAQSAILIRVWSQATRLELELLRQGTPYQMPDHASIFESTEYRCIRTLLQIAHGEFAQWPESQRSQALQELMRFPHCGLADTEASALARQLGRLTHHWGSTLQTLPLDDLKKIQQIKLERLGRALSKVERGKVAPRVLLQRWQEDTELLDSLQSFSMTHEQGREKAATVGALLSFVSGLSGSIASCLEQLAALEQAARAPKSHALTLCTIHRAKGLEWAHVFIPGLDESHYPNAQHQRPVLPSELESERRLLYVAMTRARESLHLLAPPGQNPSGLAPSPFLAEMEIESSLRLGDWLESAAPRAKTTDIRSKLAQCYLQAVSEALA